MRQTSAAADREGQRPSDLVASGYELLSQRQPDAAEEAFTKYLAAIPDAVDGLVGLMWVAHHRRDWPGAIDLSGRVLVAHPDNIAARTVRAIAFEESGDRVSAQRLYRELLDLDPGSVMAHTQRYRAVERSEDWSAAQRLALDFIEKCPDEPLAIVHLGRALYRSHQLKEARRVLDDALVRWPNAEAVLVERARLESWAWNYEAAVDRWRLARDRAPDSVPAVLGWLQSAAMTSQVDEVPEVIDEWIARLADSGGEQLVFLKVERTRVPISQYRFDEAEAILEEAWGEAVTAHDQQVILAVWGDLALRSHAQKRRVAVLRRFAEAGCIDAPVQRFWVTYFGVGLLIQEQRFDEALAVVDLIPTDLQATAPALELRSWAAARRGEQRDAKLLWQRYRKTSYIPQLDAAIDDLQLVSGQPVFGSDAIVVIAVVRNEMPRILAFLDHHRRLGVAHFLVVDNGSDDGTLAVLRAQDDVVLFTTTDDYVRAGLGMRWVNSLIDSYLDDQWCLFLDADELLVFDEAVHPSLTALTNAAEAEGADVIAGFMLDLHPQNLPAPDASPVDDPVVAKTSAELIATSPYFTPTYRSVASLRAPYESVKGGFRDAIGMSYREQTKTPLVKASSGVRFTSSSHTVSAAAVASSRVVLLHFKFMPDAFTRAESETVWSNYSYYSSRRSDLEAARSRGHGKADAVRYESSQQLAALGYLR